MIPHRTAVVSILPITSLVVFLGTSSPLAGQSPRTGRAASGSRDAPAAPYVVRAVPADGEIRLDGRLDEPVWAAAEPATDFTQLWPSEGAPATFPTEARVLIGADALYIGVRLYDPNPDSIAAPVARRDASGIFSDWVHVTIDSRMDRRTAFRFAANPRGVQKDVYHFDDGSEDLSWDAVWEVATAIDSLGWTAEFRIPFSQLRFSTSKGAEGAWGFGLMRDVARHDERSTWTPWGRNTPGFVSSLGTLTGVGDVREPRRLEVLPYVSTRLTRAPGDRENPFYDANAMSGTVGVDLKVGLPLGMTLAATINPDFGQVEVDPAQVNLTAFETFFSEKRPFFTEGADAFRFGQTRSYNDYGLQEYFYSRRVGRAPRRQLGGDEFGYIDAPEQTTILGAAKLSGKTANGWTIGVMDAVTAREDARVMGADGVERRTAVEPLTNYLIGRVRRDLRGGQTVIGAIATAMHRDLSDTVFVPILHREALLGGIDFEHRWAGRSWTLSGYLAGSRVAGDRRAIASTQRASGRYYQRPDAGHVDLDEDRNSLVGHMAELALQRTGSWFGSLAYKEASPGFEINDAGFQGRVDYRAVTTLVGHAVTRPRWILRDHTYYFFSHHVWNFDGDPILAGYAASAFATFRNFWNAEIRAEFRPGYMDDRLTRGGPIAAVPGQQILDLYVSTDPRKAVSGEIAVGSVSDRAGGYERSIRLEADVRPSTALRLRAGPTLRRIHSTRQYVTAAADPTATETFGHRYIFADLDQATLSMEARVDWTFTPWLSLQLYAQPFVSAGRYDGFKAFRTPGTYDFDVYGACSTAPAGTSTLCRDDIGAANEYLADADGDGPAPAIRFEDPDFTFRSLRGNAVLRWEYRPGSAIFFVWQQDRSRDLRLGDFDFSRDYGALFRDPGRNVFAVKVTYWFGS